MQVSLDGSNHGHVSARDGSHPGIDRAKLVCVNHLAVVQAFFGLADSVLRARLFRKRPPGTVLDLIAT